MNSTNKRAFQLRLHSVFTHYVNDLNQSILIKFNYFFNAADYVSALFIPNKNINTFSISIKILADAVISVNTI